MLLTKLNMTFIFLYLITLFFRKSYISYVMSLGGSVAHASHNFV